MTEQESNDAPHEWGCPDCGYVDAPCHVDTAYCKARPMTEQESDAKLYAERDPRTLEPHFSRHMMAMTAENLHSKVAIAEELAFRDAEIDHLLESNAEYQGENAALRRLRKELSAEIRALRAALEEIAEDDYIGQDSGAMSEVIDEIKSIAKRALAQSNDTAD